MSAAERLKALDADLPPQGTAPYTVIGGHGEWAEIAVPYFKLTLALPQIVAVVEAAEVCSLGATHEWTDQDQRESLRYALSALDEALS